ncbi:carboxylating nicotinate-nucleotide diphosphorylase [Nocardioides aurantiacus]|uniref:Nicotinate-nucleotide pyrophosphorylase [carboxylating] n=1 Tax=Nocardioides aurantiacus TaxID=86796 RepID=A0A3N2CZV5_9ACTN|nr:carboxylating nicotinate-nucleotide diphosphorylase [Nocardioides aurantiacus]ROR93061.1 nicotinate-nucleotide pyrophosphorylase [carboxylating] [Nocardioides aurantiacus]
MSALADAGLDAAAVRALLRATLAEDLGSRGDVTSAAVVPGGSRLDVAFTSRQVGVVAGLPVLAALVEEVCGPDARLALLLADGDRVSPGTRLATLSAPAHDVLALERTALNLVGHLSGVATATRAWVDAVEGTGVRVRDTRKTMPLLRALEKYAVRCGGGTNHRAGLHDAILIKDNHVAAAGGVVAALDAAYAAHPRGSIVVQVEVDSHQQLEEALAHGAEQVLLDNFAVDQLARAVALVRRTTEGVVLEASGGLTLSSAREYAETGVDYLAVGALTHSAPSLDIGLDTI